MLQKEEKYKENKMNFEGTYLRNGLADSTKIWGVPPRRNLHSKIRMFQFRDYQATDAWKWCFLYSCEIHTCLLYTGFLGPHDTLPSVLIN